MIWPLTPQVSCCCVGRLTGSSQACGRSERHNAGEGQCTELAVHVHQFHQHCNDACLTRDRTPAMTNQGCGHQEAGWFQLSER